MTTATITSPTSGKEYNLYIHTTGKAVGCTCEARKFNYSKPCKHMNTFNAPKPVVVVEQKQDQYPTLDSCDTCGALVKKGMVTCGKCLS